MPNLQKRAYVEDFVSLLHDNPQFVVVGFAGTTHKRFEEFRRKLRASRLVILKNSLFKIALEKFNGKSKMVSAEELEKLVAHTAGQSAILFLSQDWMDGLKTFSTFAKEEEGMQFRVGVIDGVVYVEAGLAQLAALPGKEELVAKIIGSLRMPSTKLVYGLRFNATQLVTVLKNAAATRQAN